MTVAGWPSSTRRSRRCPASGDRRASTTSPAQVPRHPARSAPGWRRVRHEPTGTRNRPSAVPHSMRHAVRKLVVCPAFRVGEHSCEWSGPSGHRASEVGHRPGATSRWSRRSRSARCSRARGCRSRSAAASRAIPASLRSALRASSRSGVTTAQTTTLQPRHLVPPCARRTERPDRWRHRRRCRLRKSCRGSASTEGARDMHYELRTTFTMDNGDPLVPGDAGRADRLLRQLLRVPADRGDAWGRAWQPPQWFGNRYTEPERRPPAAHPVPDRLRPDCRPVPDRRRRRSCRGQ